MENNSGKPKKSKAEWRILFVVIAFWIVVLVNFFLPDGRWRVKHHLQYEYGEKFTICDSHIQKTDSGIYVFYMVSPKENPDVTFVAKSGWSKGYWDGLLPLWHFPYKSVTENYKTAAWTFFCQEHQISTSRTEAYIMAFGTSQEREYLDRDFVEGNLTFDLASDDFTEKAEELYALYCDFWEMPPFSYLMSEPDNDYEAKFSLYVKFYNAGQEIEKEESHVGIICRFSMDEIWDCDMMKEKLVETASHPWKYAE